jgi:hypothetical protein
VPSLLLQKLPAEQFSATAKVTLQSRPTGDDTGFVVMGMDGAVLSLTGPVTG